MEDDEGPAEDEAIPPPLPPDDRLWRHPSELRDHPLSDPTPRTGFTGPASEGRPWQLAVIGGIIGALLTTGIFALVGPRRERTREVHTIEREVAVPVPIATSAGLLDVVDRVRRNVVQVRVERDTGSSAGAGVVFRGDGYIVTNQHLIDSARSLTVVLPDGRAHDATLVGTDTDTDIAVLHVAQSSLTAAPFAADPAVKVGDVTMAVGTTVSLGVISTLGRDMTPADGHTLLDLIQTDAPISLTTSGGALVDVRGNVVGIVDVIPGGSGYAVPVDTARDVATQLIESGRVSKAWLGIEGVDADAARAKAVGTDGGALVRDVRPDSPAAAAGIEPDDVITTLDGSAVTSMNRLKVLLRQRRAGTVVGITYWHDGRAHQVQVTLQERPPGAS